MLCQLARARGEWSRDPQHSGKLTLAEAEWTGRTEEDKCSREIDAWIGGKQRDSGGAQANCDPRLTPEATL